MTTKIEWTEQTWNPTTGCTKVSPGCANCYAERMAKRLKGMGSPNYANGFELTLHPHMLELPLGWRKPRRVFVNSMSDLFHPDVPFEFIDRVFEIMVHARQHTFQILTKRPARMAEYIQRIAGAEHHDSVHQAVFDLAMAVWLEPKDAWPRPNVWLGTSCENQETADERMPHLLRCPAAVRFLSLEPLLGPIHNLPLDGIHWVIVGGESGPGARPMDLDWAAVIVWQCRAAGVACFVKQLGGARDKRGDPAKWPAILRVREYPR